MKDAIQIGMRIRAVRKSKKMKLKDMATLAGLSKDHVGKIERGLATGFKFGTIEKIASALGVKTVQLLEDDLSKNGASHD